MKVYIAGPMSGIPAFNIPAFDAAAWCLRQLDLEVVSPAELDGEWTRKRLSASKAGSLEDYPAGHTWGDFLSRDVKLLADGDIEAVVVISGWQKSRGARLETFVAHALCDMPVYRFDGTTELKKVSEFDLIVAWGGGSNEPD